MAAPVGPVGIVSIRITLTEGVFAGYSAGFGVALADVIYAAIAAFGLAALSSFFLVFRTFFIIAGGCYLIYMGIGFLRSPHRGINEVKPLSVSSYFRTFFSMVMLTLANPVTLISYFGIFTALEIPHEFVFRLIAVSGVFCGSLVWWILLSTIVFMTKRHLPGSFVPWINYFSGIIITAFGLLVILSEFYHHFL